MFKNFFPTCYKWNKSLLPAPKYDRTTELKFIWNSIYHKFRKWCADQSSDWSVARRQEHQDSCSNSFVFCWLAGKFTTHNSLLNFLTTLKFDSELYALFAKIFLLLSFMPLRREIAGSLSCKCPPVNITFKSCIVARHSDCLPDALCRKLNQSQARLPPFRRHWWFWAGGQINRADTIDETCDKYCSIERRLNLCDELDISNPRLSNSFYHWLCFFFYLNLPTTPRGCW